MFEHDTATQQWGAEDGAWYQLTDQYAAALSAMARGEPDGRRRVLAAYQKLLTRGSAEMPEDASL